MEREKHLGSETKSTAFPALVAVLIVALLAVGTWATAGAAGDETAAPDIPGTGQTGGKNPTPDNGDPPAARPHPRGLPRGRARPTGRPQENREPGPLVTETVGRRALAGVGLISVMGAGLRSLLRPRSPKTAVEDPAGSEWARKWGQDSAATRRLPMDAGISGGYTQLRRCPQGISWVHTRRGGREPGEGGQKQMALILFVEHHSAFRQAASYVIDQEPDLEVVAQGGSVVEGRQRIAEGGIDAAIVDIPLPDEGAPEMVRDLHRANPSIPVLVMTHIEHPAIHEQMLRAGAAEVLHKDVTFREVLAAVRRLGHQG